MHVETIEASRQLCRAMDQGTAQKGLLDQAFALIKFPGSSRRSPVIKRIGS